MGRVYTKTEIEKAQKSYGPNGVVVMEMLEIVRRLTSEQLQRLDATPPSEDYNRVWQGIQVWLNLQQATPITTRVVRALEEAMKANPLLRGAIRPALRAALTESVLGTIYAGMLDEEATAVLLSRWTQAGLEVPGVEAEVPAV